MALSGNKFVEDNSQVPVPVTISKISLTMAIISLMDVANIPCYTGFHTSKVVSWVSSINCRLAVPRMPVKVNFWISSILGMNPSWWSIIF